MFQKVSLLLLLLILVLTASCKGISIRRVSTIELVSTPLTSNSKSSIQALKKNELTSEEKNLIVQFLYQTSQAEIAATNYLDINLTNGLYSENILKKIERSIAEIQASSIKQSIEFDENRSYYVDMWRIEGSSTIYVNSCEYWRTLSYTNEGEILSGKEWLLIAQTLMIDQVDGAFQLSDVSLYQGSEFCNPTIVADPEHRYSAGKIGSKKPDVTKVISSPTFTPKSTNPTGNTGQITWEKWDINWPSGVVTLHSHASYPESPSDSGFLTSFEALSGNGDTFGQRISGYLYPPTTGSYIFWIAGDEFAELWLSTGTNKENKVLIASTPQFTKFREWDKYES